MPELLAKIQALLPQYNGQLPYRVLLEQMSYEERQLYPRFIQWARGQGHLRRRVVFNKSTGENDIFLEVPPSEA